MTSIYHYCGHIISNDGKGRFPLSNQLHVQKCIEQFFQDKKVGSCFGSLASGADIMFAKALVEKGAKLHLVIPFAEDEFLKKSVLPSGNQWLQQFNQLIAVSSRLIQIYHTQDYDENKSYALCSEVAMGLAVLEGFKKSNVKFQQIALWDKQPTQSAAGTYPDMLRWNALGNSTDYITTQSTIELLEFKESTKIDLQALDLVVYQKNDNTNITITSINKLIEFVESIGDFPDCYIDFNQQNFGKNDKNSSDKISQRALGHSVFHYAAIHQIQTTDSFMTQLVNLNKGKVTAMDTDTFCLEDDLQQIRKIIDVDATEAIVFYAGRILEATSNFCVKQIDQESVSNVFANIEYINNYQLLDHMTRYWAHALRRLSNQYRHMLKPTKKIDGSIAVILLEAWLDWLINKSPLINGVNQSIDLIQSIQNELNNQFHLINQWIEHKNIYEFSQQEATALLEQPVFASIIIEELINKKEMPKASSSLTIALQKNPNDLRLKQLEGLLLSRIDRLEEAEKTLISLLKQTPNDDETIGILAGVIKKIWQNGDDTCFSRWGQLYLKGWELSKQKNTYLGINAAGYCLWNDRVEQSQEIANHIIDAYNQRKTVLQDVFDYQITEMDYWDQATLAEAYLLAGNTQQAQENYQQLFGLERNLDMPHEIAATQLKQHLTYDSINANISLEMMVDEYAW